MTTTQKLAKLFRALSDHDFEHAEAVARQICEEERRKGHHVAARQLRGALESRKHGSAPNGIASQPDSSVFLNGLVRIGTSTSLDDVVLTPSVRKELKGLVDEWKNRDVLDRRGIPPRSKVILHGPPGCGKSLTACAIGTELDLPVFVVRFDAIIGAYLGQTAIHLRQLFHYAENTPCILLLDELDALGKKRGNPLDVGELDRIVIALMQELEHSTPRGLVVATSNLPRHLDDALWRRFDVQLELKRPSASALAGFARRVAKSQDATLPARVLKKAAAAKSFADAEAIVVNEVRRQILAQDRNS